MKPLLSASARESIMRMIPFSTNLKFMLHVFTQMSAFKINFTESEVFHLGKCLEPSNVYEEIFACNSGSLPHKYYLGLHVNKSVVVVNKQMP